MSFSPYVFTIHVHEVCVCVCVGGGYNSSTCYFLVMRVVRSTSLMLPILLLTGSVCVLSKLLARGIMILSVFKTSLVGYVHFLWVCTICIRTCCEAAIYIYFKC